jgi:hypothetical protein
MGMNSGVPLEAALTALIVAGAAAFVAAAAIAFRLRTGKLMESLDASIGRRALKLREKEASSPAAARLDLLRGELRRILSRHGLAAPRPPART